MQRLHPAASRGTDLTWVGLYLSCLCLCALNLERRRENVTSQDLDLKLGILFSRLALAQGICEQYTWFD